MKGRERYNRALGVTEFIIEGHTEAEAAEEFGIAQTTVRSDLEFLFHYSGCSYVEQEKNSKLYIKAKKRLHDNAGKRTKTI